MRSVAAGLSHNQPGDPRKLSQAMLVEFADSGGPPVRLPLGSDTVAAIAAKHAADAPSWPMARGLGFDRLRGADEV